MQDPVQQVDHLACFVRKRHPLFAKCQAQVSLLGEGKSLVFLGNPGTDLYRFAAQCHSETPNTLGLPASQDSSWLVVDSHQYSTLCYLAPYLLELWKQALWKPLGSFFLHEPQKKNKTPNSWIHLVNLGLWWELCRWDCSRWLYCPSIVIMFVTSPYISHSGNPFFSSGGWALWMHFGLPLNHNKLPWTHLVQQNGEKGTNHKGVQDVVSTVTVDTASGCDKCI